MEKKYAIILFKGKEYLCGHEDGCHYDVSCPVRTFTEGEDDFKIQKSGKNRSERTFRYHGKEFRLVTGFYSNGWPVLSLESPDNGELYTVLTVNLEDSPAFGIPDQAFIDINNNPEAMEFLIRNSLAEDTGYRRKSGWVEYPMAKLNLAELYRLSPESFENQEKESTIEIINQIIGIMAKYDVRVRYTFEGTYKVVAEDRDEAERIVTEDCGLVLGGNIHTTRDDDEVTDWRFSSHPDMQILSFRERVDKGKVRYTSMCFSDRIEELRKDIIEAIRQLLDAHGLKKITFTDNEEDPVWIIWFDDNAEPYECYVTGIEVTDKHITVLATIKDSMEEVFCQSPFELGASNIDWLNQMYEAVRLQLENTKGNS